MSGNAGNWIKHHPWQTAAMVAAIGLTGGAAAPALFGAEAAGAGAGLLGGAGAAGAGATAGELAGISAGTIQPALEGSALANVGSGGGGLPWGKISMLLGHRLSGMGADTSGGGRGDGSAPNWGGARPTLVPQIGIPGNGQQNLGLLLSSLDPEERARLNRFLTGS